MSQFDFGIIDPDTKSGSVLASDLNSFRDALHSMHRGNARPDYAVAGMQWIDDTATPWIIKLYDGTSADTSVATYNNTTGELIPLIANLSQAINEAKGNDITSASTTNIATAGGNFVKVTGTTTITAFGTAQAGTRRIVEFTGVLTLTHNATALILPSGANITTAAGDVAVFVSLGSGNWKCVNYMRASGLAVVNNPNVKLSGDLVQRASTEYTTYSSSTKHVDMDDSKPQKSEMDEFFTVSITPTSGSNKLYIDALLSVSNYTGGGGYVIGSIFKDSDTDPLATNMIVVANEFVNTLPIKCEMVAGGTAAITFRVCLADATANPGTTYINGNNGGRKFGGSLISSIRVDEVKA